MKKAILSMVLGLLVTANVMSATNNSKHAPTFLSLLISTNALADPPVMGPNTIDVGVDLNADGTVDKWLSGEAEWLRRDGSNTVTWNTWRRYLIRLDEHAGKMAKVQIVDKSATHYIAVKEIRVCDADGVVVPNELRNGWFEDATPLAGWTLLPGGSITNKNQLLFTDNDGSKVFFGKNYYSTLVNGMGDTAVVESDPFMLKEPTSFVYGMLSGGVSELWNRTDYGNTPSVNGTVFPPDNLSYVYIDLGTETQNPNGRYDAGTDIPVLGFSPISRGGSPTDGNMHPVFLNTSGFEGRLAQVVAVDDSELWYIQMDGWRMNWDPNYITNGGFEDLPIEMKTSSTTPVDYTMHPSGKIPGWNVTKHNVPGTNAQDPFASVWFYGPMNENWSNQGYIGTIDVANGGGLLAGIEIRSDVFRIQAIPNPNNSVFMQYSGAQGTNRERGPVNYSTIQLQVDVNNDGTFDGAGDYIYREISQGMGWNLNTSNLDLWQYPDYRFYIQPAHYGMKARIFIHDTLTSGYGWMAADDFYFWDGSKVLKPFPNADFEMGINSDFSIPDWEDIIFAGFDEWLAGTDEVTKRPNPPTLNRLHGSRYSYIDGDFGVDTGGDGGQGELISVPFTIPTLISTTVEQWMIH